MSKGSPQQGGAGSLPSWLGMARNYTMPQGMVSPGLPGQLIPEQSPPGGGISPGLPGQLIPGQPSGGDAPPPMYPGGLPPSPGGTGPMQMQPPGLFGGFNQPLHPALAGLLNHHFGGSFGNNFTMPQGMVPPGLPSGVTTPQQPPSGLFGRGGY